MLLTRGTGDVSMKSLTTLAVPENKPLMWEGSVGEDLQHLEKDRAIHTDPDETRRRRTIKLDRSNNNPLGFTLQTYGIKNKKTNELEVMTYVDYVEFHGPAGLAGMRKGDVILSVNGETVEGIPHRSLVKKIQDSQLSSLRLVVLFEDCCRKVELYERFIKLKQVLKMKLEEYRCLEKKEHFILEGHGGFSRMSSVRSSLRSSSSSDWDRFSMVVSPAQMLQSIPRTGPQHFLFPRAYPSSADTSSELSLNDIVLNDSFSDDSDAFLSTSCSDIVSIQSLKKNKMNSLSNQSVSSLVTRAEIDLSHENVSEDLTDENLNESKDNLNHENVGRVSKKISGHEQSMENTKEDPSLEKLRDDSTDDYNNEHVCRDSKEEQTENSETVNPIKVVFTIDGGDDDDDDDDDVGAVDNKQKDVQVKNSDKLIDDVNTDTNTPNEDSSAGVSLTVGNSVTDNAPIAAVSREDTVVTEAAVQGQDTKGDNSTKGDISTKPKTTKRFVRGVRVNDLDQVTKL